MKTSRQPTLLVVALLSMFAHAACAQQDADLAALLLADSTTSAPAAPSVWRIFVEGAQGTSEERNDKSYQPYRRGSFAVIYDDTFLPDWRAVFSDRLDIDSPDQKPAANAINTIQESYLTWKQDTDLLIDIGRINQRNGVGSGYNPTDYFKTGAVRSIVSLDPASLRENRQGSAMLRIQKLSDSSSTTVLFSPKLNEKNSDAGFSADIGATNHDNRWLFSYNPKISNDANPQLLVFQSDHLPTQLGVNFTDLINDATVAYIEWAGGRSPSLLVQAQQQLGFAYQDDTTFRHRFSTGVTYTTSHKMTVTTELEFNGAGLDQRQVGMLVGQGLERFGQYENWLTQSQELADKRCAFISVTAHDVMISNLDASLIERTNIDDKSRFTWAELRYHQEHIEYAMQWQRSSGNTFSEFGLTPQIQTLTVLARYYF